MLTIRIEGGETFIDLAIASRKLDATIRDTIRQLGQEYLARLKADLSRPKGGKAYGASASRARYRKVRRKTSIFGRSAVVRTIERVQRSTRAYTASAPGEPPARLTGTLLRAVRIKFPGRQKGYGARVYVDRGIVFYRHFLEFGTAPRIQRRQRGKTVNRFVGRLAPRPVFSPLQAALDQDLVARVTGAVNRFAALEK